MTITKADLRALIRKVLTDATQWPDASLDQWITDSIRDYSIYFPRKVELVDDCAAGVRSYTVSTSSLFQGVVSVEYPYGQNPARYLKRKNVQEPNSDGGPYYDVVMEGGSIWLGETPTAAQDYRCVYLANHTPPALDVTALSMPDSHVDALKLYTVWQATIQIEAQLLPAPTTDIYLLSQLKTTVAQAERSYRAMIRDLRDTAVQSGASGPWEMDTKDRIY
jgi:hypothetical protein